MGILRDYREGRMDELRSLKYSQYNAREPYIQKKEGHDYNQINTRLTDIERFAKLLTSKPGLKFQGNNALLQQVDALRDLRKAAKKPGGGFNFKGLAKEVGKKALKTATNNIAATASILAQVPVNGTGTHFIRGLAPSGYLKSGAPRETGLGQFLADQGIGGGVNAAAQALNGDTISINAEDYTESDRLENTSPQLKGGKLVDLKDSRTYLGQQITTDKTPTQTVTDNKLSRFDSVSTDVAKDNSQHYLEGDKRGFSTLTFLDNDAENITETYGEKKDYLQENLDTFRSSYNLQDGENYLASPLNIQTRLKTYADQGNLASLGIDEVNALESSTRSLLGDTATDIIPFEFNIFEPGAEKFLYFRAHLDNLQDNYQGNWSGNKYIGRAEEFYTYQGFSRSLTFSFKMAAFSKEELVPLYKKLNLLVGSTAPTYAANGEFMKGTLCSLTIGDYISKQDGFISNIDLTWNVDYPWEIDLEEENLPKVPHLLDISVQFTPIHNFNAKSNINLDSEKYIGGQNDFNPNIQRRKRVAAVNTVEPAGIQRQESQGPTVEKPKLPSTQALKQLADPPSPPATAPVETTVRELDTRIVPGRYGKGFTGSGFYTDGKVTVDVGPINGENRNILKQRMLQIAKSKISKGQQSALAL